MKCMPTYYRNRNKKQIEAYEKRKREEAEKVAAMSEEDRIAYMKNKERKRHRAAQLFATMASIADDVYRK